MSAKQRIKTVLKEIISTGKSEAGTFKDLTTEEKELIRSLEKEGMLKDALIFLDSLDVDNDWQEIKQKIGSIKKTQTPIWKSALKYAALFIGIFTMAYFVQKGRSTDQGDQNTKEFITLRVGNNTIKVIDQEGSQQIVSDKGTVLGIQKGNKIKYHQDSEMDKLVYNELEIPFGKIFNVELSDGTTIHLNSGTTIKYPVQFIKGKKREVFIKGEGYFIVAKDAEHPFVVHADSVAIEVLGTEFNVSSYAEDLEVETVLVEGSVHLSDTYAPMDKTILIPGHKGTWNKFAHKTDTEEVDVKLYTGWIAGELIFKRSSFKDMARTLERTYNVSIKNNNGLLKNKKFNANFDVNIETIEDVMKSMSEIYPFSYKISNNEITIN